MSAVSRPSRAAFFIFNPSLVPKEPKPTEEAIQDAKIIYYSPSCAPIEEKRSQASESTLSVMLLCIHLESSQHVLQVGMIEGCTAAK
ncbi:unnamed protein product [Symbiodinium sp. CCMP2592]|nr:unnamed protein product [Symbiodinium sp. CCMP2592]